MRPLPVETRTARARAVGAAGGRSGRRRRAGGWTGGSSSPAVGRPVGLGVLAAAGELAQVGEVDLARVERRLLQRPVGVLGSGRGGRGAGDQEAGQQESSRMRAFMIFLSGRQGLGNDAGRLLFCPETRGGRTGVLRERGLRFSRRTAAGRRRRHATPRARRGPERSPDSPGRMARRFRKALNDANPAYGHDSGQLPASSRKLRRSESDKTARGSTRAPGQRRPALLGTQATEPAGSPGLRRGRARTARRAEDAGSDRRATGSRRAQPRDPGSENEDFGQILAEFEQEAPAKRGRKSGGRREGERQDPLDRRGVGLRRPRRRSPRAASPRPSSRTPRATSRSRRATPSRPRSPAPIPRRAPCCSSARPAAARASAPRSRPRSGRPSRAACRSRAWSPASTRAAPRCRSTACGPSARSRSSTCATSRTRSSSSARS